MDPAPDRPGAAAVLPVRPARRRASRPRSTAAATPYPLPRNRASTAWLTRPRIAAHLRGPDQAAAARRSCCSRACPCSGWRRAAGRPLGFAALTLLGIALAAASANTLNAYIERDVDARMERTRTRPLPSGRIAPGARARASGSRSAVVSTRCSPRCPGCVGRGRRRRQHPLLRVRLHHLAQAALGLERGDRRRGRRRRAAHRRRRGERHDRAGRASRCSPSSSSGSRRTSGRSRCTARPTTRPRASRCCRP